MRDKVRENLGGSGGGGWHCCWVRDEVCDVR